MFRRRVGVGVLLFLAAAFTSARGDVDTVNISATISDGPTPSQIVRIHFTGMLGTASYSVSQPVYAGQINWVQAGGADLTGTLLASMPESFADSGTFSAYCIDVTQNVYMNNTYDYTGLTDDLSAEPIILPDAGYGGMGTSAAQGVENLFANEFGAIDLGGAIGYDANPDDTDANANDQSAAFQIALWDIIYGINATPSAIDVTSSSNGFWVSNYNQLGSFSEIAGMADEFVKDALTGPDQTFAGGLLALTSPTLPDMLVAENRAPSNSPTAPLPRSGILALALISMLAAWRRIMPGQRE